MVDRREYAVGDAPGLDVRIHSGSLDVRLGSHDRIVVVLDRPDDWTVTQVGDSVIVAPVDRWRSRSSRVVAEVPAGSRLDVHSASATVRADGHFGDATLASASGDLTIGSCGALSVSSASGDVRAGDVGGDADVKTVSGDVELGHVAGRLALTTTSGDMRVRGVDRDLAVAATSGDLDVGLAGGDAIAVRTVSGEVRVGLPTGIRVKPELSTFSGRTRLPAPPPNTPAPEEVAERRLVRLTVKSVSGDIDIHRAG